MTARERVAVTGPPLRDRQASFAGDLDRRVCLAKDLDTAACVRSLMRTQLRLALASALVVAVVAGGLPLLFALCPEVTRYRVASVPLPWLVLGTFIQPIWVLAARWHVRRAERAEKEFTDLVAPP